MKKIAILTSYEDTILGNQQIYFVSNKGDSKDKGIENAIALMKYVFEEILEWTPGKIKNYLTYDLIEWLHLERAYNKIPFPVELDKKKDCYYLASVLYPDSFTYSRRDFVKKIYSQVLSREMIRFPKNFFSDAQGEENLKTCFSMALEEKKYSETFPDVYEFFSDTKKAEQFLKNVKLYSAVYKYYDSPLELLHDSLNVYEKNEFLYKYYQFKSDVEKVKNLLNETGE